MSGRFGHFLSPQGKLKHLASNPVRRSAYRYGIGGAFFDLDARELTSTKTNLAGLSFWKDTISGIEWTQPTAGNQPRFISSDATFNNLPVIEFHAQQRYMDSLIGLRVNYNVSIAIVFQKLSNATGSTHKTSLFGEQTAAASGLSFSAETSANAYVGFTTTATHQFSTAGIYDTNKHIVIISGTNQFYSDGAFQTMVGSSWTDFVANRLSGANNNNSGTFKLAQLIGFDNTLSPSEMISLYNNIAQTW